MDREEPGCEDGTLEYHRTVHEAVSAAQAAPAGPPASDNSPPGRSDG